MSHLPVVSGRACVLALERVGFHALLRADPGWLARLITRREKPEHFREALKRRPDDIKTVIQFAELGADAARSGRLLF